MRFQDNPKYFYLYLIENSKIFSPFWATKNYNLYTDLIKEGFPAVYIYSVRHFIMMLRAHVIVCDDTVNPSFYDSLLWFLGRFNCLLTWHGTGFKNIGLLDDKYARKDYLFSRFLYFIRKKIYHKYFFIVATSEKDRERKMLCFQNDNVFITGSPRNVIFHNKSSDVLRKKYNLGNYDKVILYAPTYRENSTSLTPFTEVFFTRLQAFLEANNTLFILKKHKYDRTLEIPSDYKNIVDITEQSSDVQELLSICDLLISDYSGIVSDYVLREKPILFYIYDYDEYIQNCRSFSYDLLETLPGPFIYNENELLNYLKDTGWFYEKEYQARFNSFKEMFQKYSNEDPNSRLSEMLLKWYNKK